MTAPPAEDATKEARPLSTPAAIALSGLTAALVMIGGVLVAERAAPPRRTEPLPPPPRATVVLPVESAAPVVASAASIVASAAPIAVVSASAAPPIASAPLDPASLPERRGALFVSGPSEARVYIKGEEVGAVNEALVVPCGLAFVRLGTPPDGGRHPTWIGAGQSVVVRCRAETRVAAGGPARP